VSLAAAVVVLVIFDDYFDATRSSYIDCDFQAVEYRQSPLHSGVGEACWLDYNPVAAVAEVTMAEKLMRQMVRESLLRHFVLGAKANQPLSPLICLPLSDGTRFSASQGPLRTLQLGEIYHLPQLRGISPAVHRGNLQLSCYLEINEKLVTVHNSHEKILVVDIQALTTISSKARIESSQVEGSWIST
jgi:hypothetical protein